MKEEEILNYLKDIRNKPFNSGYVLFEPKDEVELVAPLKSEVSEMISNEIMKSLIGKEITIKIGDE